MINCSVCMDEYKCPRFLPCGHTFCEGCILGLIKVYSLNCPECRTEFRDIDPEAFPKNFTLQSLIEEIKNKPPVVEEFSHNELILISNKDNSSDSDSVHFYNKRNDDSNPDIRNRDILQNGEQPNNNLNNFNQEAAEYDNEKSNAMFKKLFLLCFAFNILIIAMV